MHSQGQGSKQGAYTVIYRLQYRNWNYNNSYYISALQFSGARHRSHESEFQAFLCWMIFVSCRSKRPVASLLNAELYPSIPNTITTDINSPRPRKWTRAAGEMVSNKLVCLLRTSVPFYSCLFAVQPMAD